MRFRAPFELRDTMALARWLDWKTSPRGDASRVASSDSPWGEHSDVIEQWFAEGDLLAQAWLGATEEGA